MNIANHFPFRSNFHTLHSEEGSEHHQDIMNRVQTCLFENEVPFEIAKVILQILNDSSSLFSIELKMSSTLWNGKKVYLLNSSYARLNFIGGKVFIGGIPPLVIDAGLVIFARKNYDQAYWIYTQEQVSRFGIAR